MAVAKDYSAGYGVLLYDVYEVSVAFLLHKVHYGNAGPSAKHAKHPSQLRKMTHVAPSLLANQSLVNIDLVVETEVRFHEYFHVVTHCFADYDEEISHGTVLHQEVSLP